MHVKEWFRRGLGVRVGEGHNIDDASFYAARSLEALPAASLYRPADLSKLFFSTTADLEPIDGLIGQTRALEALRFGTQANKAGFNLFVIGPDGARMQDAVKAVLTAEAGTRPFPTDWVYVNNFVDAAPA
jgi:hypothetical protein